jgi:hypothetical protein
MARQADVVSSDSNEISRSGESGPRRRATRITQPSGDLAHMGEDKMKRSVPELRIRDLHHFKFPQRSLERRGEDGQHETEKPDHPASIRCLVDAAVGRKARCGAEIDFRGPD